MSTITIATLRPRTPLFPYTPLFRSVVAKRAPGGSENWAVLSSASASFSSGWITDDGDDYNYLVWATSTFNAPPTANPGRSEEHTSELQSLRHLVCRLLLEKTNAALS